MNKLNITLDGPLHCKGNIEILGSDAHVAIVTDEVWLCRCGASQNKPHCDGSHKGVPFRDAGTAATGEMTDIADGTLKLSPRPDGPIKCQGPMEIVDATGRSVWRGSDTALCRCGASGKKPFCDGTHRLIGFKTN